MQTSDIELLESFRKVIRENDENKIWDFFADRTRDEVAFLSERLERVMSQDKGYFEKSKFEDRKSLIKDIIENIMATTVNNPLFDWNRLVETSVSNQRVQDGQNNVDYQANNVSLPEELQNVYDSTLGWVQGVLSKAVELNIITQEKQDNIYSSYGQALAALMISFETVEKYSHAFNGEANLNGEDRKRMDNLQVIDDKVSGYKLRINFREAVKTGNRIKIQEEAAKLGLELLAQEIIFLNDNYKTISFEKFLEDFQLDSGKSFIFKEEEIIAGFLSDKSPSDLIRRDEGRALEAGFKSYRESVNFVQKLLEEQYQTLKDNDKEKVFHDDSTEVVSQTASSSNEVSQVSPRKRVKPGTSPESPTSPTDEKNKIIYPEME